MAPMIWDVPNMEKLMIYLLASNPHIKLNFEGAAKYLTNKEQSCTARAVQERFKKMKKTVGEDPRWVTLAEQAAQGHGKAVRRHVAHSSDDERPLTARSTKRSTQKNGNEGGAPARKRRKASGAAQTEATARTSADSDDDGGESATA